jgi:Ca2+-binding EF-hand superfamily protein
VLQSGVMAFIANMLMADEELNELQKKFMMMDKDNDGFLSIEELKEGVKSSIGNVFLTEDYYD